MCTYLQPVQMVSLKNIINAILIKMTPYRFIFLVVTS
jgi:hypothetical protein